MSDSTKAELNNATICNRIWDKLDPTMKRQYSLVHPGNTGYIDYLDMDVFENDLTVGRDRGERKYIAFKAHIATYRKGDVLNRESGLLVFHERYIGRHDLWVGAGDFAREYSLVPHDMPTEDMLSLEKLILGEAKTITVISTTSASTIYIIEPFTPA